DYGNAVDFVDNNNTWTAAEWHNIQMDDAALDAHWALQEVYDYFVAEHGRESYDDANGKVKCYVHFGQNWGNAQWDGDKIRLGDGNNNFRILAAFDVIAHEFGHGVCQETCALEYEKESGAINESLSDIWAATIEEYSVPLKQEWRIGEEITLNTTALRAMDNPNLLGQPDTYGGTFWTNPECGTPSDGNDYCGVHTNSGVMNFWFYLLAEGGTGTNDNGDCYFVEGIGIEDAAEIVYSLEADYLDDESNFDAARTYSIQAARNLNEEIQISNAWYAVGVGDEYQYQISGPSTVCSSGSTFSVSNPPTIDSIIWSIGPNLTIYSGQNSNSPIIKATGTGNSWVQARLVTGCGSLTLPQRTVWAGIPDYTQLDIYANNSGGSHIILACDYTSADALYAGSSGHAIGIDAYEWDMPYANNWDIYEEYGGGGIDMRYVEIEYWESPPPSTEVIGIRAHNTCGWSPWRNIIVNVENHCSRLYMSFSPNPTTGETTLTIQSSSEKEILDVNQEWDLEVYTQTQVLKAKKIRLKGSSTVINTSGWQEGVYVVRALYNNEVITGKLIVKR
ncbi:MAG: M4 family metallopeptidase, partial [Bacteroidales bacterium]